MGVVFTLFPSYTLSNSSHAPHPSQLHDLFFAYIDMYIYIQPAESIYGCSYVYVFWMIM